MTGNEQPRESLATGFRNVDNTGDTATFSRCLALIAGIPFFRQVKEDSIRIIAAGSPHRVLDAGCGAGGDLPGLVTAVHGEGEVVGLDASSALLGQASARTSGIRDQCRLARGDILALPFRDDTFGACRIDRVLQHISDPARAVEELARVLSPGGVLVAFDNDWDTFFIDLDDMETAGRIKRSWRDSFASGRVGRDLGRIFDSAGLTGISVEPRELVLTDYPLAEQIFDLTHLIDRMVRSKVMTAGEAAATREEIRQRAGSGTFRAGYTGYLVQAIKEKRASGR
jgi:SAM-dependent methyltransferase